MNKKLYELPEEWEQIGLMLEESEGDLTPEIEKRMGDFRENRDAKVEAIACIIQEQSRSADAARAEGQRLAKLAAARAAVATRLKTYLLDNLLQMDAARVQTPRFTVRIQRNSQPSTSWSGDPQHIPDEWRKALPPPEPVLNVEKCVETWKELEPQRAEIEALDKEWMQLSLRAQNSGVLGSETSERMQSNRDRVEEIREDMKRYLPEGINVVQGKHVRIQ